MALFLNHTKQTNQEQKENYNKAVKALSDYAAIVPELAEPRLILANILLSAGRAPEAETAFQKGVALYEQSPLLDERIAGYLTRLNRFKEAEPYLEDLVRFEPGKTDYAFDLVRVYYLNGKKDAAKTLLLEIQKKDPKALEGEKELVQTVLGG
jgi:Flp pilus assembly protein TadD